jgi:hypothetical protein
MASGSATPPAEGSQRPDAAGPTGGPAGAGIGGEPPVGEERYGPLRVLRTRKDDGRSLILYSDARLERADSPAAPGGDLPSPSA